MSRERTVRLSAAGFSDWIGVDFRVAQASFAIGLGVKLSSNGNLTYSVQHTMDNIYDASTSWSAARTTTTGTITKTNHGLSVDDWVLFEAAAPFNAAYSVVSVTDQNTFVVTVANSGATAVVWGNNQIHTGRLFNHENLVAQTTSGDGNYAFPPRAIRLIVTTYTAGYADLTVLQAGG